MKQISRRDRTIFALLFVILEVVLFGPSIGTKLSNQNRTLSTDQYWEDTKLSESDLTAVLNNKNCYESHLQFLACVNALSSAAERFNTFFNLSGQLQPISKQLVSSRLTEKRELLAWTSRPQLFSNKKIDFEKAWSEVQARFVDRKNSNAVLAAAINGYLAVSQDPHTYIMPIRMYEELVSANESRQINIGVIVKRDETFLMVRKVFPSSPSEIAGVRIGDKIVKINGTEVSELLPSRVNDLMKMRETNRIGLHLERNGVISYVEIMKGEVVYPSVSSRFLDGNGRLGLLTIHRFAKGTCTTAKEKVIEFMEQRAFGIVLDLRDNPGGQVDEAACIANLFVEKGRKLFETRYLGAQRPTDYYTTEQQPIYLGPLAVLINSGSASASEIVAGALKDLGRATLVGERTFGKGSFQDGRFWPTNSRIALFQTEGLYYFPSGWTPQLSGIEPDIEIGFNSIHGQREVDLYMNPVVPAKQSKPIQSRFSLTAIGCDLDSTLSNQPNTTMGDDPQFLKAQAFLQCGKRYGQNGSF